MKTVEINSAYQLLDIVHKVKTERRNNHPANIEFYRGQSNQKWGLLPSISMDNLIHLEQHLVNEFKRRRPDEFDSNLRAFDLIAKMQHYGLQTRLLDVSENPAVALFFACNENNDVDGEFFIFNSFLGGTIDNEIANTLLDFHLSFYIDTCRLRDAIDKYNVDFIKNLFFRYHILRANIISERIKRQSGAFLICNGIIKDDNNLNVGIDVLRDEMKIEDCIIYKEISDFKDTHYQNNQDNIRYLVKKEYKKKILDELETIGIYEAFLFPELSYEGKRVMQDYLNLGKLKND